MSHPRVLSFLLPFCLSLVSVFAILHPQDNQQRLVKELNGLWSFRVDFSPDRQQGFKEKWFEKPLDESGPVLLMAVPSSFNDITEDRAIRDYVGWAWYEKSAILPPFQATSNSTRYVLRFEGVHYYAMVWVNGVYMGYHDGGRLPFEFELKSISSTTRITVAVNNTLTPYTLPCGRIQYYNQPPYPKGYFEQDLQFDFFNYAGIHRTVSIYTTSSAYIYDINTTTAQDTADPSTWYLRYQVTLGGSPSSSSVSVKLFDRSGQSVIASGSSLAGNLKVKDPQLWWPWSMNLTQNYSYMYILQVDVSGKDKSGGNYDDQYRLKVGFRSVRVTSTQFLINGKPFYFNGVDKHEDADIRGKGFDYPLYLKDIYMMKWLGVSAIRTSHYPYATEFLDMCDEVGIAVIGESTAVGLQDADNFNNITLQHHLEVMKEMIGRDKNHPGIVMWSLANEPNSALSVSEPYFKTVFDYTRQLDPTRPATFTCNHHYYDDLVTQFVDVVLINRYYGWYEHNGHLELIHDLLAYDLEMWYEKRKKPMMISEYGAGTVIGFHVYPSMTFTEDYQLAFHYEHFQTFNEYRGKFLVGELIWNFADFMTAQSSNRVWGNRKGILDRQRQPKPVAYLVQSHYWNITRGSVSGRQPHKTRFESVKKY